MYFISGKRRRTNIVVGNCSLGASWRRRGQEARRVQASDTEAGREERGTKEVIRPVNMSKIP